jgi:hypothetical protein
MHESVVSLLQREVRYNKELKSILTKLQVPHVLFYSAAGRSIKCQTVAADVFLTLEPRPDRKVKIHLSMGKATPVTYEVDERVLTPKLYKILNALEKT